MKAKLLGRMGVAAVATFAASGAFAVSMTKVGEYRFGIDGCGGITYAGNGQFYILQDHDSSNKSCVYPTTININPSSGAISSCSWNTTTTFRPGTNGDSEGIAYDPGSGCVWISDEATPTIKEFLTSGMAQRTAPVPSLQQTYKRANKSLESLTISGDGLTMWTANEEALTCDGEASQGDSSVRTIVRLVRFTRSTLQSAWTASGQWAYRCDPCRPSLISSYKQSGLSGLCALPDGSLLALEREVSTSTWGRCRIYRIPATEFVPSKDVSGISSLANASYTRVGTELLLDFEGGGRKEIIVYEGICLGPRLADGSLSVILVSDGGASKTLDFGIGTITASTVSRLCMCKLSGLNVRTVNLNAPTGDTAGATVSKAGQNFRYLNGSTVSVSVSAPDLEPVAYTNNGTVRATATYTLANGTPATGDGSSVTFTVDRDETLSWQITRAPAVSGVYDFDTFEEYAAGATEADIAGWSGDCETLAETYSAPTPPGYAMPRATGHTKILDVGDTSVRTLTSQPGKNRKFDMMVMVSRGNLESVQCTDDMHVALSADANGRFNLWHRRNVNGSWTKGWTQISNTVFNEGEWVRVTFDLDYTTNPSGMAFGRIYINGVQCVSAYGYQSPSNLTPNGPWHRLASGSAAPTRFGAMMTKLDDFIVTRMDYVSEIIVPPSMSISVAASAQASGGTAYSASPCAVPTPAPVAGASAADETEEPLLIVGIRFVNGGFPQIKFSGYSPERRCVVLRATKPDFSDGTVVSGTFGPDAEDSSLGVWTGEEAITPGASSAFYRIVPEQ